MLRISARGEAGRSGNEYVQGTTSAEGLVYFHDQWFLYRGFAVSLIGVVTTPKN